MEKNLNLWGKKLGERGALKILAPIMLAMSLALIGCTSSSAKGVSEPPPPLSLTAGGETTAGSGIGIPVGEGKRIYNPDGAYHDLDNGTWYFFLSDTTVDVWESVYGDTKGAAVYGESVGPYYNGDTMRDVVFSEHLGLWTTATLDYALWIPDSYEEHPDGKYALVMNNPVSQRDNVHPAALTRAGILTAEGVGESGGGTNPASSDPRTKTASDYFISDAGQKQVKDMYGLDGIFVLVPTISNAGRVQDDATVPTQHSLLLLLCDALIENYPIDTDHIYATGQSVGGMQLSQINSYRDNFLAGFVVNGSQWYSDFYKDTVFNGSMANGEGNNANPSRLERHYTLTDDRIIWDYDEGGEYDWLAWLNVYYMTSDDNLMAISTASAWDDWNSVIKGLTGYGFAKVSAASDGSDLLTNMAAVDNSYNGAQMGLWQVNGIENEGVGNAAVGRWLLSQTRSSEAKRPKLDINKPFDGTPGTAETSASIGLPNPYQYAGLEYYWVPTAPTVKTEGGTTTTSTNAGSIFYNSHIYDASNPVYALRPAGWLPTVEQTSVSTSQAATPLLKFPVNVAKIQSITKVSADGSKLVVALEYNVNMENAVIYRVNDKVQSEYWFVDTNANKNGFAQASYPRADFVVMDSFDFYTPDGTKINDLYDITLGNDNPEYVTSMKSRISKIYINDEPKANADAGDRTGSGKYVIVEIATSTNPDAVSVVQRAPIIAPEANAMAPATYKKLSSSTSDGKGE